MFSLFSARVKYWTRNLGRRRAENRIFGYYDFNTGFGLREVGGGRNPKDSILTSELTTNISLLIHNRLQGTGLWVFVFFFFDTMYAIYNAVRNPWDFYLAYVGFRPKGVLSLGLYFIIIGSSSLSKSCTIESSAQDYYYYSSVGPKRAGLREGAEGGNVPWANG